MHCRELESAADVLRSPRAAFTRRSAAGARLGLRAPSAFGKRPPRPVSVRTQASRRILRRLQLMEKLPLKDKRELLSIIDTYLEKNRLAKSA